MLLAAHPSQAKNPRQAARNHIRQANGYSLIFLESDKVLPICLAFRGARLRLPLDSETLSQGLEISEILSTYLPVRFPLDKVRFVTRSGEAHFLQDQASKRGY